MELLCDVHNCEPAIGRPTNLLNTVENTPITINAIERIHSDNLSLRLHTHNSTSFNVKTQNKEATQKLRLWASQRQGI